MGLEKEGWLMWEGGGWIRDGDGVLGVVRHIGAVYECGRVWFIWFGLGFIIALSGSTI